VNDSRIQKRIIPIKDIIRLVLKSAVETGTPFTFNRDIVNEANPNSHSGIIYCSNLCTEIAQNMSGVEEVDQQIQTVGIGDFKGFIRRLETADFRVGKGHMGVTPLSN